METELPYVEEALRQTRDKRRVELSERLADVLYLRRVASIEQIAARMAALEDRPPPRRTDTQHLLAAMALCGDCLADEFVGTNNDELLVIGEEGLHMVDKLMSELAPGSVRSLAEDLGLADADLAAYVREVDSVRTFLAGFFDQLIHAMYWAGWLKDGATTDSA